MDEGGQLLALEEGTEREVPIMAVGFCFQLAVNSILFALVIKSQSSYQKI